MSIVKKNVKNVSRKKLLKLVLLILVGIIKPW